MTSDVAERTEAKTETEASQAVETEARESTDNQQQETQTDTGAERTSTEESSSTPDPRTQRVSALAEAERAEIAQQAREQAIAEIQGTTPEAQRAATKRKLQEAFPKAQAKIDEVFKGATYDDGSPRPLNPVEQTAVKNALAGYNLDADAAIRSDIASEVTQIAFSIMPKAAQEAMNQLTTEDMPLPDYLNAWVETAALHTKAVKGMTLEDAIKHSPKLKREIEALKLSEFDAGRDEGLNAPPGSSPRSRSNEKAPRGQLTFNDLEDKYGRGETTAAETREYERLKAERAKAGR